MGTTAYADSGMLTEPSQDVTAVTLTNSQSMETDSPAEQIDSTHPQPQHEREHESDAESEAGPRVRLEMEMDIDPEQGGSDRGLQPDLDVGLNLRQDPASQHRSQDDHDHVHQQSLDQGPEHSHGFELQEHLENAQGSNEGSSDLLKAEGNGNALAAHDSDQLTEQPARMHISLSRSPTPGSDDTHLHPRRDSAIETDPAKFESEESKVSSESTSTSGTTADPGPSTSGAFAPKANRVKRDGVKKIPKVYPPRKPRVRPVNSEQPLTLRTDSALSTLASAAVAIKNHQGDLSTFSVPPLSPTMQSSSHPSSPFPEAPSASSPPQDPATATASHPANPSHPSSRSMLKAQIPHDAGGYRCELCPGERFGRVHDLKRHQISKHNEMTWPCDFCHRPFVRRDALLRHYSVKSARHDGVHPTAEEVARLSEAKARAKLLS